jgi:hypothetical protein
VMRNIWDMGSFAFSVGLSDKRLCRTGPYRQGGGARHATPNGTT